jgi:hypothetical protein
MKVSKIQKMDMHMHKLVWYSIYVDCFVRVIREFVENGECANLQDNDIPNLLVMTNKFAQRLRIIAMQTAHDWEFD